MSAARTSASDVRRVGAAAVLVEFADPAAVPAWYAALSAEPHLTAAEIVPGARTILLDGVGDPAGVAARLASWSGPRPGAAPAGGPLVEIPTVYDGPDLDHVARLWRTDRRGVVARHTAVEFRAAFCGFAPGFAYLTGLPAALAVPRRPTPRPVVAAGSVALAGMYTGVYPTASPGGWQLLGRTASPLFDLGADPPARLAPGTRVRFVEECP